MSESHRVFSKFYETVYELVTMQPFLDNLVSMQPFLDNLVSMQPFLDNLVTMQARVNSAST